VLWIGKSTPLIEKKMLVAGFPMCIIQHLVVGTVKLNTKLRHNYYTFCQDRIYM